MPKNFPSEQVIKTNGSIKHYHICLLLQDGPKYEVDVDQQKGYQHILLGRGGSDIFPQVEAFWQEVIQNILCDGADNLISIPPFLIKIKSLPVSVREHIRNL